MADLPETLRDGRYAVVRVLGEGGQATTFEAVDKRVGRLVAVKRFRVRGAASWKEVELAEREARVIASVDHPRLPRYVDHFEEAGELFLVTEKIEGESLAERRRRGAPFAEADAIRFLRDASDALDYLHGRAPPIIHRDIKPSNVIRRPDGTFSLIDFGAVRDKMKPEGGSTVVGTFGYMAPEQFQGRALPASDVYAVGATAVALLSGREPEDLPHRGLAVDVAAALAGTRTSPALIRALAAMLEPDPDRRPAAVAPLLAGLGDRRSGASPRVTAGQGSGAPDPHEQRRRDRAERREQRQARRALVRAERDARRAERRAHRGEEPRGLLSALIFALVVLALALAEIAVMVATRVIVPVVLSLLSIIFGRGLRRAAGSVGDAGKSAAAAIARAREGLRVRDGGMGGGAGVGDVAQRPAGVTPSGAPHREGEAARIRVDVADSRVAEADREAAAEEEAAAVERERMRR